MTAKLYDTSKVENESTILVNCNQLHKSHGILYGSAMDQW